MLTKKGTSSVRIQFYAPERDVDVRITLDGAYYGEDSPAGKAFVFEKLRSDPDADWELVDDIEQEARALAEALWMVGRQSRS